MTGAETAKPAVSVLIATYQAEAFVHRAIESALSQTLPVAEVLVVDDASTDGTPERVRRLARLDGRIRLIELSRNGGPSTARNAGLDAACGEWIAVLDADDAFTPSRLEQMLGYGLATRADIVVDNFRYYYPSEGRIGTPVLNEHAPDALIPFAEFLARARPFGPEADWGLLKPVFRRSFLNEHRIRYPVRSRHGEDFLLLFECFVQGARYALHRVPGYLYTSRTSGLSRTVCDYDSMFRHTLELLQDPRIAGDRMVLQRLRERASAVRRLAAEVDFAKYKGAHDYAAILRRILLDGGFRKTVARKFARRLIH